MKYGCDFVILEDEFGYYVSGYRIVGGVESLYCSNGTIAAMLNLLPSEYAEFIHVKFNSDQEPKNEKMHFSTYEAAEVCRDGLRALLPRAIETGNLFFAV